MFRSRFARLTLTSLAPAFGLAAVLAATGAVQAAAYAPRGLSPAETHEAARAEGVRSSATPVDASIGPALKSYFHASPAEVRRRERTACARLGFEPAAPDFNGCVAGLQSAMFSADNPEN